MNKLDEEKIRESLFDAMLIIGINYFPSQGELKNGGIPLESVDKSIVVNGCWLYNAIRNRGGTLYWRSYCCLKTKEEYREAVKRGREKYPRLKIKKTDWE